MPVADTPAQSPAHHAPAHHAQARMDHLERAVRRAVNRTRARHGLRSLRGTRALTSTAKRHSRDLVKHGVLSHSSSNGSSFSYRIHRAVRARSVGENLISYHGRITGSAIVGAWMHSAPHRAVLLSSLYRRIGIGRSIGRRVTIVTADFASGR